MICILTNDLPPKSLADKIREVDRFIAESVVVGDFATTLTGCERVLKEAGATLSNDADTVTLLMERLEQLGAKLVEDPASNEWYWSGVKLRRGRGGQSKRSEFVVILSCADCGARGRAIIGEDDDRHPSEDPKWAVRKLSRGFIARKTGTSSWGLKILCQTCLTSAWH